MGHLATSLFFIAVLAGALLFAVQFVRANAGRIAQALRGELPLRAGHRPWPGSRVRVTVGYRQASAMRPRLRASA